jgi:hypothetical protein
VLEIGARDDDQGPAEEHGGKRLEGEAEDKPARTREEGSAQRDERKPRRPRHAPEKRIVERRVGRNPICEWADECAHNQSDEARRDIH